MHNLLIFRADESKQAKRGMRNAKELRFQWAVLTLFDELIAGVKMMKQEMLQTVLCVTWSFLTALVISG